MIFFSPKKPSKARQQIRKRRSSAKEVQGQILLLCLEEGQGMVQVEVWGNLLPLHRTLRRQVLFLCYSAVVET